MSSHRMRQDIHLIEESLIVLFKELWRQRGDVSVPEPEEDKLRVALLSIATQPYVIQALATCDLFRLATTHYEYSLIDFTELSVAVSNLGTWLSSSSRYPGVDVVSLSVRMASSLCLHLADVNRLNLSIKVQEKESIDEPMDEPRSNEEESVSSDDSELGLFSENMTKLAVISLKDLREAHKNDMRGARIVVRDGKYEGSRGVFCSWSGTVVYVRFDSEPSKKVAIPVERYVSILSWSQNPSAPSPSQSASISN